MSARQLAFDLEYRPALEAEDFLVGPSNRDAVAWIDSWPNWPNRALALFGDAGCGKTHLAHVWQARAGAALVGLSDLDGAELPRVARGPGLAVEVGERIPDERLLLHLLNLLRAEGASVLLLARRPPAHWPAALPDLTSRLSAIPAVRLGAPDDALLQAVLVKLFADRQIRPDREVVSYLATRLERSFAAMAQAVGHLDRAALAEKRRVSLGLVRRVLEENEGGPHKSVIDSE